VKFENTVKQGDSLKILISNYDYYKIGSREKATTFGIENDKIEFLNAKIAIRNYNSGSILFGIAFIIVGLILLYLDIKRRTKKKIEEDKTNL
jgi:hypothetical protein